MWKTHWQIYSAPSGWHIANVDLLISCFGSIVPNWILIFELLGIGWGGRTFTIYNYYAINENYKNDGMGSSRVSFEITNRKKAEKIVIIVVSKITTLYQNNLD